MTLIWLLLAALCQTAWIWSTTQLSGKALKTALVSAKPSLIWPAFLPLGVYLIAGISNVLILALAMQTWPASITYGVWTGLVMVLAALREWIFDKKTFRPKQVLYLILIFVGIAGLHFLNHDRN
jgi:quaternary ammonium compound-resistance protein SugE